MRGPLLARLRQDTAQAHAALEEAFNLEAVMSGPAAARRVLKRFYGFHVAWEPALRRSEVADFAAARSRLPHLRADLASLGATREDLSDLPRCEAAAQLPATRAGGVGSLYVMEGSTLGGQVISRALKDADWAPPHGFAYFNPYGADTGPRWRSFMDWAAEAAADIAPREVSDQANATFALLHAWLVDGL